MIFVDKQGEAAGALTDALSGTDYVSGLERALSAELNKNVVAVCSPDAALHTALHLCGVERGDLVFVPTVTFYSYVASVAHVGAVPIFLDCDPATRCVSPSALETALMWAELQNKPPKAVVIDNAFGAVADFDVLAPLCKAYGAHVVELACDAFYGAYNGRRCGTNGDYGVLAFDKRLHGGGGALVYGDEDARVREFTRYAYSEGENYDYRLNNFVAALDYAQLSSAKRLYDKCKANLAAITGATENVFRAKNGDAATYAFCRAARIVPDLIGAGFEVKKPPLVHTLPQYGESMYFEHEQGFSACEQFSDYCLVGTDMSALSRIKLISMLRAVSAENGV